MKRIAITAIASLMMSTGAWAAERTIVLEVQGMTCASCPYQVESTLKTLDGVKSAHASLETHQARVTYDDAKVTVKQMTKALTDMGYPASPAHIVRGRSG